MSGLDWLAVLLWIVVYDVAGYLWRRHRVAVARQNLFEVRDALFIEALSYKTRADREAAMEVREVINSVIRYAHKLSFVSLMAYNLTPELRQIGEELARNRRLRVQQSSKADHLEAILRQVVVEVNNILVHRSLIVLALLHVVTLIYGMVLSLEQAFKEERRPKAHAWKGWLQRFSEAVPSIAEIDSLTTRYT